MPSEAASSLLILGLGFLLLGLALLLVPAVGRLAPYLERLPPYLLFVHRADGFVFATSPALIAVALVLLLWRFLG